jgi:hypothetical protein
VCTSDVDYTLHAQKHKHTLTQASSYKDGYGSVNKAITDLRAGECTFRYFTHSGDNAYDRLGESNAFRVNGAGGAPYHGHLALTANAGEMLVHFGALDAASEKYPRC